jgi:hypothetical protein
MNWESWIRFRWNELVVGAKLQAPRSLGSPQYAGFRPTRLAAPEGQASDWALAMSDGSRVHVHVYADGRQVAHRDKFDPDRGVGPMLAHLALDTPYVLIVLMATLFVASSSTSG